MRLVAIIFCAALFVGLPTISHAQYNDNDQQNPKEYHDEDSQPLALLADVLYPIGYGLEWLVARPMHWVANDSPAAPMYRPVGGNDMSPPPPVPIIPDNTMDHDDDVNDAAGLVSDQDAQSRLRRTTVKQVIPSAVAAPPEQSAGASLNFRVPQICRASGLSSPLNLAYLWVIEFLLIGYVQSDVDELM